MPPWMSAGDETPSRARAAHEEHPEDAGGVAADGEQLVLEREERAVAEGAEVAQRGKGRRPR